MSDQPIQAGPLVNRSIVALMRELEPIGKDRKAYFGKFRSIDDIYNHVGPLLAKHGLFPTLQILAFNVNGRQVELHLRVRLNAEDGTFVESDKLAIGRDQNDTNAFAANIAESVGIRDGLIRMFMIPVESVTLDPENMHADPKSPPAAPAGRRPTPATAKPPAAPQAMADGRIAIVTVAEAVSERKYENTGKTSYGAKLAGVGGSGWVNTFDRNLFELATRSQETGEAMEFVYHERRYGPNNSRVSMDLDEVNLVSDLPPADPPAAPPPSADHDMLQGNAPLPESMTRVVAVVNAVQQRFVEHMGKQVPVWDIETSLGTYNTADHKVADAIRECVGHDVKMLIKRREDGKLLIMDHDNLPF